MSKLETFSTATPNPLGIYLDHHSTTPVDPRVANAVLRAMVEEFGNANSVDHAYGEIARSKVNNAKECLADLVNCDPTDIHFTSGSTEAILLAISHAIGIASKLPLKISLSRVEHPALLDAARRAEQLGLAELTWISVGPDASVNMRDIHAALDAGCDLLCIMAANNEVGTIYPIAEIAELAATRNVAMLVDATQSIGRIPLDLLEMPIEYVVVSAHKIYGPKGIGALISTSYDQSNVYGLTAVHEATPNVPGIVGFGEACKIVSEEGAAENVRLAGLRDKLQTMLTSVLPDMVVNGQQDLRLPHNLHFSVPGVPNDLLVQRLRRRVALSTGAACMSGAQSASHVLVAMGLPQGLQDSALRIGLGRGTTDEDIMIAAREIIAAIRDLQSVLREHTHG
ncbi:cysteine desulfurase family protein [Brucella intermedia]|uniref:cysteine desulfurase family protein n=1 Tax=Brucella intermedia TaxID=94625 RepID=UPI0009897C4C|nr:cysteine desulfurase family protein [Brucella intermedia]OOC60099.1 hypothetical protein AS855_16180 [Brucella intermedia M86]